MMKNLDTLTDHRGQTFLWTPLKAILIVLSVLALLPMQALSQGRPSPEVELQGELEVVYEDSDLGSRLLYFLNSDGKKLSLKFAKDAPEKIRTGMRVSARGVRVGETLELNSGQSITPETGASLVAGDALGQHRVAVIMVNFADKQTQPFSREQAQSVMFGSTNDFFREASYGQTWLTGDVYGWYTIPLSSTTCDTSAIANYANQAATQAGANLSAYQHHVYAFPRNACTWQGRGSVGGTPSQAWVNDWFELGIVGHELGHNLGLYHSKSMDCGALSIGTNCSTSEYGDTLDLMGAANSAHFNLFQKERLGWVNSGNAPPITTVNSSGTYWLDVYEPGTLNPKGLKILKSTDPVSGLRTWYYIEHRTAFGFDNFLSGNSNVLNGIVIRTGSESAGQDSYLLDMTPGTTSWYDPALTVGESFVDVEAGVSITTTAADGTGALVTVVINSQPCQRSTPTLTVGPSQGPWVVSGSSVTVDVSVKNNDTGGCLSSDFDLAVSAPANWLTSIGSSRLTVDQGATETITVQVASPVGTTDGIYAINFAATNSASPGSSVARSFIYSLVSGLVVSTTASQITYSRSQTATVNATVWAAASTISGAYLTFVMTKPNGTTVTSIATSSTNGVAVFKYSFNRKKDPPGLYLVRAEANFSGLSGTGIVSFVVK